MSETVAVLDYGMGNLHSAAKALEQVASGQRIVVSADPATLLAADRVVFPGVGAIRDCMRELAARGLDQALHELVARGTPLLGVCVGMQALMQHSEENGGTDCLGILPGEVVHFGEQQSEFGHRLKVPHMGWNQLAQRQTHPLWEGVADYSRFYFVHSYYVSNVADEMIAGCCQYGIEFAAAVCSDTVFAVQFHPEKSAANGLALLANFLRWAP